MKILFLHGHGSRPGGTKPMYLFRHGHDVINPALPAEDFEESVRIAQQAFDLGHPDVVVGSSRGGAVAMNLSTGKVPLVLIAPAWKRWGTAMVVKKAVTTAIPGTGIAGQPGRCNLGKYRCVWPTEVPKNAA